MDGERPGRILPPGGRSVFHPPIRPPWSRGEVDDPLADDVVHLAPEHGAVADVALGLHARPAAEAEGVVGVLTLRVDGGAQVVVAGGEVEEPGLEALARQPRA